MSLFRRIFGGRKPREADNAIEASPPVLVPRKSERRVTVRKSGDRFVQIDELDLFGTVSHSPNGRFSIVVGTIIGGAGGEGTARDGAFALLEGDILRAKGSAERPHEAGIADNGAFVISDSLHDPALKGRFLAFHPDGTRALSHEFSANLGTNAISADGRFAACQTYNSPGSPDSCIVALFDVEKGAPLARIEPACGTAHGFEFDAPRRRLHVLTVDGDVEVYGFDGIMVDRDEWLDRRIARGDLRVIGDLMKRAESPLNPMLVEKMLAGLKRAQVEAETWTRARAFRLHGELLEAIGQEQEALTAYEQALLLDPQVGISRRADKLRRRSGEGAAKPPKRRTRFEQQAERLGIGHEQVFLETDGAKRWRYVGAGPFLTVEEATLDHFRAEGWSGAASEGGLILTLIKASSFGRLHARNADTFVEALYAQNVAFDEDRFESARMIETIRRATREQVLANWKTISATAGTTPAFYPRVNWDHVDGLFSALGTERLAQIATIFATAPYDLRAGWPDLTLWRGQDVRFVEVKSPTDRMHVSQARLISTILVPLGFDVTLAEVKKRPS